MIPKILHYCWFGKSELPDLAKQCIASWHQYMPDWQYLLWNEDNFSIADAPTYVQEAYFASKFAFVSDYVRLFVLHKFGGVYLDVDFYVFKSFEPLLNNSAFAGYEGSKRLPIMMGVLGSIPNGRWVSEAILTYNNRHFISKNGSYDLTPNTSYLTNWMIAQGLILDGREKFFNGLHIYPVDYFCPLQTSGENLFSENTYCEHRDLRSWDSHKGWKYYVIKFVTSIFGSSWKIKIIKLKRKIFR